MATVRNWSEWTDQEKRVTRLALWRLMMQAYNRATEAGQGKGSAYQQFGGNAVRMFLDDAKACEVLLTEMKEDVEQGRRDQEGVGAGGQPSEVQGNPAGADRGEQNQASGAGEGAQGGGSPQEAEDPARNGSPTAASVLAGD